MTPEAVCRLYDYTYWAFERVWQCITALSDAQFVQPLDYSTGSIRNHVVHLMSSTDRWLKRLQGVTVPSHLPFDQFSTRKAAKAQWDQMRVEALAYIHALDQRQLDEVIHWELQTRHLARANPRWELLLHVANHATDHRAQILALLHHHFGAHTVEQDMLFFLSDTA